MPPSSISIPILLALGVSALLVISGVRNQPGLGVIGSAIVIGLALWLRGETLLSLGFGPPPRWAASILLGVALGLVIQLLTVAIFEPLSERITGTTHDHSLVAGVKGNWKAFAQWVLIVWLFVAFLEEGIYRGFLLTEFVRVMGTAPPMLALSIIGTSLVFGLSHSYQGRSGALSTGIVGVLLGTIFVLTDFNLWLPILTHGFVDTIGLGLMAIDGDKYIRSRIWGSRG